jgi:hypothetical protein
MTAYKRLGAAGALSRGLTVVELRAVVAVATSRAVMRLPALALACVTAPVRAADQLP